METDRSSEPCLNFLFCIFVSDFEYNLFVASSFDCSILHLAKSSSRSRSTASNTCWDVATSKVSDNSSGAGGLHGGLLPNCTRSSEILCFLSVGFVGESGSGGGEITPDGGYKVRFRDVSYVDRSV